MKGRGILQFLFSILYFVFCILYFFLYLNMMGRGICNFVFSILYFVFWIWFVRCNLTSPRVRLWDWENANLKVFPRFQKSNWLKLVLSKCSKYGVVGDTLRGCFTNLISGYNTLYTNPSPAILYFEYDGILHFI